MKRVRIADLKNHLSEHLRAVEGGAEIEVTDRSRPIARLVPVPPGPEVRLREARTPFEEVRDLRPRPARWPGSSLEALREERGDR